MRTKKEDDDHRVMDYFNECTMKLGKNGGLNVEIDLGGHEDLVHRRCENLLKPPPTVPKYSSLPSL